MGVVAVVVAVVVVTGSVAMWWVAAGSGAPGATVSVAPVAALSKGGLTLSLLDFAFFLGHGSLALAEFEAHLWVILRVEASRLERHVENALLDLLTLVVSEADPKLSEVKSFEEETDDKIVFPEDYATSYFEQKGQHPS